MRTVRAHVLRSVLRNPCQQVSITELSSFRTVELTCMTPSPRSLWLRRIALAVAVTSAGLLLSRLSRVGRSGNSDESWYRQEQLPSLCAHRIFGDEANGLATDPRIAIAQLAEQGIRCFDVDVVRCELAVCPFCTPYNVPLLTAHLNHTTVTLLALPIERAVGRRVLRRARPKVLETLQ